MLQGIGILPLAEPQLVQLGLHFFQLTVHRSQLPLCGIQLASGRSRLAALLGKLVVQLAEQLIEPVGKALSLQRIHVLLLHAASRTQLDQLTVKFLALPAQIFALGLQLIFQRNALLQPDEFIVIIGHVSYLLFRTAEAMARTSR